MIEENPWPIEVLVDIFKWLSIEERRRRCGVESAK